MHLKGFSVPKIYLLAAKGSQDRRDEFFHNRKVEHEDALHDAELDWLLYNKPLEYAQLVLGGEIEHYLSLGRDHGRLED